MTTKRFCECRKDSCGWCSNYDKKPIFKDHWDKVAGPKWERDTASSLASVVHSITEQPEFPFAQSPDRGLGDKVEQALSAVGITKERVSKWLGQPCNCTERREKLNALGFWAQRVVTGKLDKAKEYLSQLLK